MLVAAALAAIKPTARGKVFRLTESGFLYNTLDDAAKAAAWPTMFSATPAALGYVAMLDSTPPV